MWYYEARSGGKWSPRKSALKPVKTQDGRLKRIESVGPVIRGIQPIPPELADATLSELADHFQGIER